MKKSLALLLITLFALALWSGDDTGFDLHWSAAPFEAPLTTLLLAVAGLLALALGAVGAAVCAGLVVAGFGLALLAALCLTALLAALALALLSPVLLALLIPLGLLWLACRRGRAADQV